MQLRLLWDDMWAGWRFFSLQDWKKDLWDYYLATDRVGEASGWSLLGTANWKPPNKTAVGVKLEPVRRNWNSFHWSNCNVPSTITSFCIHSHLRKRSVTMLWLLWPWIRTGTCCQTLRLGAPPGHWTETGTCYINFNKCFFTFTNVFGQILEEEEQGTDKKYQEQLVFVHFLYLLKKFCLSGSVRWSHAALQQWKYEHTYTHTHTHTTHTTHTPHTKSCSGRAVVQTISSFQLSAGKAPDWLRSCHDVMAECYKDSDRQPGSHIRRKHRTGESEGEVERGRGIVRERGTYR